MIYARRSTALHAARPAVVIGWSGALTFAVVACPHPAALLMLVLGLVLIAAAAQVLRPVLLASAIAVPFAALWIVTNGLLVRDGLTVVARLGTLPGLGAIDVTAEALTQGAVLALRAVAALQIGLLASACIDPDRLLASVRRVAPRAGLTGAVAIRLAPALASDGRRYADGLRCRADGGRLSGQQRGLVLAATLGRAIDRSDQIAAVLELRGLGNGAAGRVRGRHAPWSRHDTAVTASAVAVAVLASAGTAAGVVAFRAYPTIEAAPVLPALLWSLGLLLLAAAPLAARRGTEPRR